MGPATAATCSRGGICDMGVPIPFAFENAMSIMLVLDKRRNYERTNQSG